MTQCASHALFEQMMQKSIDTLAERIGEGIRALTEQSRANGAALQLVLDNQSSRRELCGRQDERLRTLEAEAEALWRGHEKAQADLWEAVNALRRYVYMGLGGVFVINAVGLIALKLLR